MGIEYIRITFTFASTYKMSFSEVEPVKPIKWEDLMSPIKPLEARPFGGFFYFHFMESISESQLEDILFSSKPELIQRAGIHQFFFSSIVRQLKLGKWGRADLVTFWRQEEALYVTVYELKQGVIDISVVSQASKYCQALSRILRQHFPAETISVSMVGVGASVRLSPNDKMLIDSLIYSFSAYSYHLSPEGIKFKCFPVISELFKERVDGDLYDLDKACQLAQKSYDNSAHKILCNAEGRRSFSSENPDYLNLL